MSILFVIIAFLLFWVVPQINDLIVVINQAEKDWAAVFIFFSTLSVFAFIISNIGYYFTSKDSKGEQDTTKKKLSFLQAPKDHKEVYLMQKKASEEAEIDDFQETHEEYIRRLFPKFLGTVLILIAAYAVNNTYEKIYNISAGIFGLLSGHVPRM